MNHTPTPWRTYTKGQYDLVTSIRTGWAFGICSEDKKQVAIIDVPENKDSGFEEQQANANFIVTACNAHEDLKAALKEAWMTLAQVDALKRIDDGSEEGKNADANRIATMTQIEQALAKAEVQS